MTQPGPAGIQIAIVGDYDATVIAHQAIPEALRLAGDALAVPLRWSWLHTAGIGSDVGTRLAPFQALWLVPASPYADTDAARRQMGRPFFLGTLLQPERAALRGQVPPVVRGLVQAAWAGRLQAV